MNPKQKDEISRLSSVVLDSLDEERPTADLAKRSFHSRTHFHRLFRSLIEETPGAMRRRLLLERAAWYLSRTETSITEIAFETDYGSLEAFTRAFRRRFGASPSLYRRMGATHFWLVSSNGIHFCAPGSHTKGALEMDLFDRLAGHDSWHTRKILEQAKQLSAEQLDAPIKDVAKILPWEEPEKNMRDLLERLVFTKEIWTAALTGKDWPESYKNKKSSSIDELISRYEKVDVEFNDVLRNIRDRGAWDDIFVDALCEPAETFTFGGMFAHYITFTSYRRLTALAALRQLGLDIPEMGCPTEYEQAVQPWKAVGVS